MDTIMLPSIDSEATIEEAIDVLKNSNAAALVTEQSSELKVIDIDLILYTLRDQGNVKISTLKPRFRALHMPTDEPAENLSSDKRLDAEDLLDNQSAAYAVTRFVGNEVEILTRHEIFRDLLAGQPTMWRCQGDPPHVLLTRSLLPGNVCRYDGFPADPM